MVINKPADTDGQPLKVVAISDVHLGYATNKAMLERYVDLINAERPDLVIIGGDLIDNSVVPLHHEHMEEELSRIYAPLGVYMVPGNHEYISGIDELEKTEKAGVDLQFSGHTHRGQVWPMSWIVDRMFELSYGIKKIGNSTIYVSSGLSLWGPPFRIGTDSEIVVFQLTFEN